MLIVLIDVHSWFMAACLDVVYIGIGKERERGGGTGVRAQGGRGGHPTHPPLAHDNHLAHTSRDPISEIANYLFSAKINCTFEVVNEISRFLLLASWSWYPI